MSPSQSNPPHPIHKRRLLLPTQTAAEKSARHRREAGQATAEYALVMLAAAALAGLLLAWASGTDGVGRLFDAVLDSLIGDVG